MAGRNGFFALLSRMRYIVRWGLMRSSIPENIQEHSHETAVYAHALGLIRRRVFRRDCDAERLAVLALYHDAGETITGDLPTPVKYHDPSLRDAYRQLETLAGERLLGMLPEELKEDYRDILIETEADRELWRLVKAADKLSALAKCIEERKAGNREFLSAERSTRAAIAALALPEADWFLAHCMDAFELNLDELGAIEP